MAHIMAHIMAYILYIILQNVYSKTALLATGRVSCSMLIWLLVAMIPLAVYAQDVAVVVGNCRRSR